MDKERLFQQMMNRTKIIKPPRHTLATFGTTTLSYVLLSEVPASQNQCRLREGRVTASRPQIITPDLWRKRFEGFGEETETYKGLMDRMYGEAFRALEYTFKNELQNTSLESASLLEVTDRTLQVLNREDTPRTALLEGPDASWTLSVMKFIVDMSMRSFPVNLRELDEHDAFTPEKRVENQMRHRVEQLFKEATSNPSALKPLGELLKESGLFSEYEDRFFAMVKTNA